MSKLSIWRVYVAIPLRFRERKHTVRIYRVGAESAEAAKAVVQEEILSDSRERGYEILEATYFGNVDSAVYDGMVTKTPAELAAWKKRLLEAAQ